jgi:hypothetical protein
MDKGEWFQDYEKYNSRRKKEEERRKKYPHEYSCGKGFRSYKIGKRRGV